MVGLTDKGFTPKTAEQIIIDCNERFFVDEGEYFDPNADVIGRMYTNMAVELSATWQALNGLFNALDPETNTGVSQDFTGAIINVTKQQGQASRLGNVELRGREGAVVNTTNFRVAYRKEEFVPLAPLTLSSSECVAFALSKDTYTAGDIIAARVNGLTTSHTIVLEAGEQPTVEQAVDQVVAAINLDNNVNIYVIASRDGEGDESQIRVEKLPAINFFVFEESPISMGTSLEYIANSINMTSLAYSKVVVPTSTNLTITIPASDITAAHTTEQSLTGRLKETPEEFRVRRKQSFTTSGGGSLDAIRVKVLSLDGVNSVQGFQNRTKVQVGDLPPNSYHLIIDGTAPDEEIAKTILAFGPAGIEPYGTTSLSVNDNEGNPVLISFTRTAAKYISVQVTYTLFTEEPTPINLSEQIIQAIMDAAEKKSRVGIDLIPEVYEGAILYNVTGLSSATVQFSVDDTEDAVPTFTTGTKVINASEVPVFHKDRVVVI